MSPDQCRAARALIGISRPELSDIAKVAKNTVRLFETGQTRPNDMTIAKLRAAFVTLSVRFIAEGDTIGVWRGFTLDEIAEQDKFADIPSRKVPAQVSDAPAGAPITPAQSRAARAFLNLSQLDIAVRAGVGLSLVVALETGYRIPRLSNILKIRNTYENLGVAFTIVDGIPAVQSRRTVKQRPEN